MNFVTLTTISNQTVIITPRYSGQILRLGATEVVTSAEEPVRIYGTGTVEISEGYWDELAIVEGEYFGRYFDGDTTPDSSLTPSWTGTANASPSILTGVGVAGVPPTNGVVFALTSRQWSGTGARSLRLIPRGDNNSFVDLGGGTGGMRYGMIAGRTYTILATYRLAAPQTGALSGYARRVAVYHRTGTGPYMVLPSPAEMSPNVAGAHSIRYTVTIPEGTTEAWPRLFNGAPVGGGEVRWDDLAIIEGVYDGPWFDGDNPPSGHITTWTGTPNASTSVLRVTPDGATFPGWAPGRGVPQVVVDDPTETLQLVTSREVLADYTVTIREVG